MITRLFFFLVIILGLLSLAEPASAQKLLGQGGVVGNTLGGLGGGGGDAGGGGGGGSPDSYSEPYAGPDSRPYEPAPSAAAPYPGAQPPYEDTPYDYPAPEIQPYPEPGSETFPPPGAETAEYPYGQPSGPGNTQQASRSAHTNTSGQPELPPLPERRDGKPGAAHAAKPADPLELMIGQMLLVGFGGALPEEVWPQRLASQLKAGLAGGVIFMSQNVRSRQQVQALTSYFRGSGAEHQVLIAIDQEGGAVQRLSPEKGFQKYPPAEQIGRGNDPHQAYLTYKRMAEELAAHGFNLNFGPVADLNRNPANPIIAAKNRSFGNDPKHVIAYARAFCFAHRDAGLLTVMKHFPGHGSSDADSHERLADISRNWDEIELEPYRALAKNGFADMVMVGHLFHPRVSGGKPAPASLSAGAIEKLLRERLGYAGPVITDDLDMGAIRKNYSFEESLILAVEAGNDILLLVNATQPDMDLPEKAVSVIRKAIASGRLTENRIRTSYERILALKAKLAQLHRARVIPVAKPLKPAKQETASP